MPVHEALKSPMACSIYSIALIAASKTGNHSYKDTPPTMSRLLLEDFTYQICVVRSVRNGYFFSCRNEPSLNQCHLGKYNIDRYKTFVI